MQVVVRGTRRQAFVSTFLIAMAAAQTAAADSLTLMWDPSADSNVAGYVVYVGTQPGSYASAYDVGYTTQFVFGQAAPGQQYYFSVAAYAPGPLLGPASAEVSGVSNAPPVLANPGDQAGRAGEPVVLQLAGADPDGQPISYGASGLPPGLEIAGTTGVIRGIPAVAGTFLVTAMVTDGVLSDAKTFTWTIGPALIDSTPPLVTITAPTMGDTFATDQIFVTIGGTAEDDDRVEEVEWSNDRGASGRATGTDAWIAGIPLQRGPNTITVKARDGAGNVSSRAIVVKSTGKSK